MLASEVLCLVAQPCLILCSPRDCSPPSSPSMGILQASILEWLPCPPPGGLPNPGIEPRSPSLQGILYLPSYQGSPRTLEWVAYPFSRVSFQPRNWTSISCIVGGFQVHYIMIWHLHTHFFIRPLCWYKNKCKYLMYTNGLKEISEKGNVQKKEKRAQRHNLEHVNL